MSLSQRSLSSSSKSYIARKTESSRARPLIAKARRRYQLAADEKRQTTLREVEAIAEVLQGTPNAMEANRRVALLRRAQNDLVFREQEIKRCKADPAYMADNYGWTYDPRVEGGVLPFALFDYQRDGLLWWEQREVSKTDGVIEKSRDMGATWIAVLKLTHRWLFTRGWKGAIGSRKATLVDRRGDPDSIFEKIRIFLRYLPEWLMPIGFDWRMHDGNMRLVNPQMQAAITGEAGDNMGRGGRNAVYVIDEHAFVPRAETVQSGVANNSGYVIYISTPNGQGNLFYRLRFAVGMAVLTLHWKRDPRKHHYKIVNRDTGEIVGEGKGEAENIPEGCTAIYPYYEAMRARLANDTLVAQELDIDYAASLEGIIIPAKHVLAAVNAKASLGLVADGTIVAGFDIADGGANKSVLVIRQGPVVLAVYERSEGGTTDTAMWALELCRRHGVAVLFYDSIGVGRGVAGTYRVLSRENRLGLIAVGVNVGQAPTDARWPDGQTSKMKFQSLKGELWSLARVRFEKTWEMTNGKAEYPLDELISIPNNAQLKIQLSQVRHWASESGKTIIESKAQLEDRGIPSPDFAEAFLLTFARVNGLERPRANQARTMLDDVRRRLAATVDVTRRMPNFV